MHHYTNRVLTSFKKQVNSVRMKIKFIGVAFLFLLFGVAGLRAQSFVNGNLSTGPLNSAGAFAPLGFTWSELQGSNTTFGSAATSGSFRLADNFNVNCGPWNITKFVLYGYVTAGGPNPINDVRLAVYNTDPSVGSPAPIFGDFTTNRFSTSNSASVYRIANGSTDQSRQVWRVEVNVPALSTISNLANGNYWIVYSLGNTTAPATTIQSPLSTVVGTTTQPGNNAKQFNVSTGTWANLTDVGGPQDLPFEVIYSTPACSGTPAPGNTLSTEAGPICASVPFTLSMQNPVCGSGITHQWQYSTNGGALWTNITGANSSTLSTTFTNIAIPPAATNIQFRVIVNCASSGLSGTSTAVSMTQSPLSACYCIPPATNCADAVPDRIENVTFGGINNNTTCSLNGYGDFTSLSPGVALSGIANSISVTVSNGGNEFVGVWIDYNQNGVFESAEYTNLGLSALTGSVRVANGNINIPVGALSGTTRMRVRVNFGSALTGTQACTLSSTFGETEDYLVNITPATACTGTPVLGTVTSSPSSVCANANFTLTLSNAGSLLSQTGYVYQWQSSTDNITYTNITGANTATYTGTQISATWYRLTVTCTASGLSATTAGTQVTMSPLTQCYCTPGQTISNDDDVINNVTFAGINNNSGNSAPTGYSNYTNTVWPAPLNTNFGIAYRGVNNPISITVPASPWTEYVAAWIDYNRNGVFDTDEYTFIGISPGGAVLTNNIAIPNTAQLGLTRMRVRIRFATTLNSTDACIGYTYGETEDYLIDIRDQVVCGGVPTIGAPTSSIPTVCPGEEVTLSVSNASTLSGTVGLSLQWQFAPTASGPWTAIGGATSVTYTTTLSSTTFFRLVATCGANNATSAAISVGLTPPTGCYCSSAPTSSNFSDVTNVTLSTLNNSSDCSSNAPGPGSVPNRYSNYTAGAGAPTAPIIFSGTSNPFSVSLATCGTSNVGTAVSVWIDLNQDGIFADPAERVYLSPAISSTFPRVETGTITIPSSATVGITRMRVVNANVTTPQPCGNYGNGETEDYLVDIRFAPACNNTFTPTIVASNNPVCPFVPFTLSVTNATGISGLSFQWQSSPDGVTWTNTGSNNAVLNATQSAATFYRVQVQCIPSATNSVSNVVQVTMQGASSCYCIPASSTCTFDNISNVNFGGINNNSGCVAGGYTNFAATVSSGVITKGSANPISVTTQTGTSGTKVVGVWIDYNQNGTFETTEFTSLGSTAGGVALVGSVIVPPTATNGITRMRVRVSRTSTPFTGGQACTTITNGETEDYNVNIVDCAPVEIVTQPQNAFVTCGNNTSLSVSATASSSISYQWLVRTTSASPWVPVTNNATYSGATASTLNITAPPLSFNGYEYAVTLTSSCLVPDTSNTALLTVTPAGSTVIISQPPNTSVNCGSSTSISFTVSTGASPQYQWQFRPTAASPWTNVTNNLVFSGSTTTTLSIAGATNTLNGYQFRAYISSACSSSDTTNVATLTVNPVSLTLSIVSNAPSNTICNGTSVTFTATPAYTGGLAIGYRWFIDNIATANAASSGTTINVASTAQLVPGMVVSVFSGSGAFAANTSIVSITNATSFVVSATPSVPLANGSVISAYLPAEISNTFTFSNLANGNQVRCRASVNDGSLCTSPNPSFSNTITMTVNPNTTTAVALSTPSTTICANTNTVFTANPTNPGTNPQYQFFIGNTSVQGPGSSNTYSTSALTNGQLVKVRMTSNANNCPAPNPARDSLTMVVNPSFPVSVTLAANPGGSGDTINICGGIPIEFTATGINAGSSPNYKFRVNGVVVQNSASNIFTISTLADGDVVDCILNSNIASCAPGNPDTSNVQVVNIEAQTASVALSFSPNPACAGGQVTYTATATNGGGAPTFTFYVNGVLQGSSGNTFQYIPSQGDSVSVEMSSSLPCAQPNPASNFIIQQLQIRPTATISSSIITCSSGSATLDAGASAGSGTITSIQWQLGGTNINGATGSTYFTTTNGNYTVVVTNSNGCSFTSAPFNLTTGTAAPMSGSYTVGAITATGVSGSGQTLTCASTSNLTVGAILTLTSGTGVLAANTVITGITNATQFTVNNTPTTALSGATVAGATCTNYISIAAAVADLNARTINGNCTFNVPAGYVENLTARIDLGSAALNPTLFGRTITFQKSGNGPNPVINAYTTGTGTPSTGVADGMWALCGIDNVTIDGINLNDGNAANYMEYGYGFFRLTTTDGAQNNTIRNSTISLKRENNAAAGILVPIGSTGILFLNATSAAPNTALLAGGANGAVSNNKIYSDSIINCNNGIVLKGHAATSPFTDGDAGNDIGGSTIATGNAILNFGGGGSAESNGVQASNQWGLNVSYNKLDNNTTVRGVAGSNHAGPLSGIKGISGTSASVTINNNDLNIKGGGNFAVSAIENSIGSTAAGNTVNINNNTVTGSHTLSTTATYFAINNAATAANLNMNGNTVSGFTFPASSGEWRGVYNAAIIGSTINMNANTITGNTINSTNANCRFLYTIGSGTITTGSMSNNTISTNTRPVSAAAASTLDFLLFSTSTACNLTASGNTISDNVVNITTGGAATQTINCMNFGSTNTLVANNNTIQNNGANINIAAGAVWLRGIALLAAAVVSENVSGNTVNQLYVKSTNATASTSIHQLEGIVSTGGTGTRNFFNNTIQNLYSASGYTAQINGIRNAAGSLTLNIYRNRIFNLFPGQSATAGSYAYGIRISNVAANGTSNVYNNMVSLDLTNATAPAANSVLNSSDGLHGIDISGNINLTSSNVVSNTVRLAGTGTGTFGSSAFFHQASTTGTQVSLILRNNIFVNECTPVGSGFVTAIRRSVAAALQNYATSSDYNNLFVSAGANRTLYYDGTNSYATLAAIATNLGPRDQNSKNSQPQFVSTTDLHLQSCGGGNASLDGTGAAASLTLAPNDFDDEVRNNPPDIGADEFNAISFSGRVVTNTTVCPGINSGTLTLTGATGTVTTWEFSIDSTNWTAIPSTANLTSYTYTNVTVKTWYRAQVNNVTCAVTQPSIPASVSVFARPQISLTNGGSDTATAQLCNGSTLNLFGTATAATVNPWVSTNTSVLTISNGGVLSAQTAGGPINIIYTNSNGCKDTIAVTVNTPPTISGSNSSCVSVNPVTLTGSTSPLASGTTWNSSNTSVLTVSGNLATTTVNALAAGTANITFTSSAGCVSAPFAFTVNASPNISLTSGGAALNSVSLCAAASTNLFGTPTANAINPWTSSNASVFTVNGSGFVTAGASVGTANITYTNSVGCSRTIPVNVIASPTVTGTLSACVNGNSTLTGNGTPATAGTWSSSNTSIATVSGTAITTSVVGVSAGTATITYTTNNGCQRSVVFTVNPLPTQFTVTGGGSYCAGSSGVSIGLSNSQSGVNYQLVRVGTPNVNVGSPIPGNTSALNFGLQTVAGTYQVEAVNTTTNCIRTMLNQVSVLINPLPTITGNMSACEGNSTTLFGNGTAAAVNPWVSSDVSVATVSSLGSVSALTVGTTTISYTNANGCRKDTLFTVTSPSVAGTASGNNTVCSGTNSSVITLSGNTGSIQWQLSTNNVNWVNIGGATSSAYTATNLSVESYYRAVVTNGTCSSVTSNTVTISINPLPTAFSVTGGGAYCQGDGGVSIGLSGSQSGVQYQLFRGATLFATANGNGSALDFGQFTQAGNFTVVATNLVTNCQANMTGLATVTIKLKPAATISPAGPVNICSPSTQTLTATPNISSADAAYQWYLDGSPITGATANTYSVSAAGVGIYSVVITNTNPANGCVGLKAKAVIVNINSSPTNVSVSPSSAEACSGAPTNLTASNDPVELLNAVSLLEDFNGASTSWVIANGPTSPAATNWVVSNAPLNNTTGLATFSNFVTQDAGKFILADADAGNGTATVTAITSPVFSLANFTSANLSFEHALRSSATTDNAVQIDISTDGGTNWALLKDYLGQNAGTVTNNNQSTVNDLVSMNAYLGQSNLRIRYRYESNLGFYWIVDNVKVSGTRETPVSYTWSPALGLNSTSGSAVISTVNTSTTYTVTATAATCSASATSSITITPNPSITTQPTTPAPVCSGAGTVSLSVAASGNNLVYIWRRNGSNLSNNAVVSGQGTATLTLTNPTSSDAGSYDVQVSGVCGVNATSSAVTVSVTAVGTWLGISNVWNDPANWCGGIPTSSTNVTIPVSANYPVITTQLPVCNNLTLVAGTSLTVQGKLAIHGTISNAGTFITKDGTIEMAGSTAQTIPAGVFQNNNLRNLIIANSSVTLGGNLNLLNKLSFSGSNRTFATAGFLTLKSSDTLTASVGDLTNNNTTSSNQITGNVTTERFVTSRRAWRLLSMPTQHNFQSIKQSWQEGATGNAQNPVPGFGIQITSNRPSWIADGFDTFSVAGPSVKCYNPQTNLWDGILNTTGNFEVGKAYMTFIRGNRSVTQINQAPTTTILRERGGLVQGTFNMPSVGTAGGQFVSVGNPFASAIDFSKLGRTNIQSLYYLWDPLLGTFGGYQTCLVDAGGNVSNTPGGGSYTAGNFTIQSGQGFFIRTTAGVGALSFPENAKADGSVLVTRSINSSSIIRTNLFQLQNGTPVLYDGVMNRFDDGFVSDLNQDDAEKLGNFNENLGILRDGKTLAIESRPMPTTTDTIHYRLGQVRMTNYRFVLQTQGMAHAGAQAYLEDLFTHTSTPVEMNGETTYDFTISNNPSSYATSRFRLVFRPLAPVPVTYTDVKAEKDDKRVRVSWTVEHEVNIVRYQIEKSTDGTSFTSINQQTATGSRAYLGYDEQPVKGNNYYRVKAIGSDGSVIVSRIVRVVYEGAPMITVQPNPIPTDGIMQVFMTDMPTGRYKAVLIDATGRQVYRTVINHNGLNQLYRLAPDQKMAQGMYQLILTGPDGQKTTVKVLYESH